MGQAGAGWAEHRAAALLQGQGWFGMSVLLPAGRERASILEMGTFVGKRIWESHPDTLLTSTNENSSANWLSLPGREWLKAIIDPGSHRSDNSFCLLLFHLPWLLLPSSDVCRCARDVQDKGPALLPVSCSTPGSRKRQSLWPLQEGVG